MRPSPALARTVTKVGVIGAGLMAGQLALLFARRMHVPVVLTDVDQARLDKGLAGVRREIDTLRAKKRISPDEANRLTALVTGSLDYAAFADADFVIEAVFEEIAVKKDGFRRRSRSTSRTTAILATNTSSLSVTAMAADLAAPGAGGRIPLLQPGRGHAAAGDGPQPRQTDDASLATAFAVAKALRKTAILVADTPAFVVNRLLTAVHGRGHRRHRRGHRPGRGRRRPGPARSADVADHAAPAGRAGRRPARVRDAGTPPTRIGSRSVRTCAGSSRPATGPW